MNNLNRFALIEFLLFLLGSTLLVSGLVFGFKAWGVFGVLIPLCYPFFMNKIYRVKGYKELEF